MKLTENSKITMTIGQLKRLIRESKILSGEFPSEFAGVAIADTPEEKVLLKVISTHIGNKRLASDDYSAVMNAYGIDEEEFRKMRAIEYVWHVVGSAWSAFSGMKRDFKDNTLTSKEFARGVQYVVKNASKRLRSVVGKPRLAFKKANGALFGYYYNGYDYGTGGY